MCFLAYKLCMLFVLRFPWLQCNSKELWFMRISKSGLRKFSVIYLVLICCIPCTGKSVDSHEITEKLYTVYTIPSWMSYSWDPVLSSSWKTSTKNNFKSLHFLLYKCFLWLWETGCAKKKKKKMYSWCCCLVLTTICLDFWTIAAVLHSLPAEHAGEFKGCPLLDRIANYIDFFNAFWRDQVQFEHLIFLLSNKYLN